MRFPWAILYALGAEAAGVLDSAFLFLGPCDIAWREETEFSTPTEFSVTLGFFASSETVD